MTIKRTLIALVCAALAAGTPSSPAANPEETNPDAVALDPDYAAGKQALERKDWGEAAKRLGRAVLRDPDNADLHNDLGFAHRKLSYTLTSGEADRWRLGDRSGGARLPRPMR